jgi:MarR family transcriptional regulator, lower aerobic nicotinate degradation pathway regulator
MKTSLDILKDILNWLEEYQNDNHFDEYSLESFILWLNSRLFSEGHAKNSQHSSEMLDMELSFLLVMQSRYYKTYAKRVLGESELTSPDGFSFLYHLSLTDSFRKMELIKMHHLEPPSGIEVLKRLIKKGFIAEFDDADDKRAKRISITEKGKKELQRTMPKMKEVFQLMTAELSLNEKLHAVGFLKQMNDFHASSISKT